MTDRDPDLDEMPKEIDFSDAADPVIGKYAHRLGGDVRMVVLDQDVAARFPDSAAVNDALRSYLTNPQARTDG